MSRTALAIGGAFGFCGALCYGEQLLLQKYGSGVFVEEHPLGVPKLYGAVILVNGVLSTFLMLALSFGSGAMRRQLVEKAKKDGDEDRAKLFKYPKLYAEGTSDDAHNLNCVVRGHQHALETYPSFLALSLLAGLRHPLLTSAAGLLWIAARYMYAQGYSTGDPMGRYRQSAYLGPHVWTSLLLIAVAAASTGLSFLDIV